MKKVFLSAVVLLSSVLCVNAQKELAVENQYPGDARAVKEYQVAVEKQTGEKISALRTSWLASRPSSNWFISGQIGMGGVLSDKNLHIGNPLKFFDEGHPGFWQPTYGLAVGKWLSPVWGLRLSANYGESKAYNGNDATVAGAKRLLVTGDFLLNLKNFFRPYNPKAVFNPVVYLGAGNLYNMGWSGWKGMEGTGNFMAMKAGLQLNFRLCDAWDIFLDGNAVFAPNAFDSYAVSAGPFDNTDMITSVSLGFTYKLPFRHFVKAPLYNQAEVDALLGEINDLRNRPEVVCPPVVICPEEKPIVVEKVKEVTLEPVFFTIGSAVVRDNQLLNVAKAAQFLIDNPDAKLELASYADKKTGTAKWNMTMSKMRSEAVAKVLTDKFGIDKARLIQKYYGDTVQPFQENDWNRVTIFVK
jgi:outer membrane protein OmpA-like peptidoglycan-associated protein